MNVEIANDSLAGLLRHKKIKVNVNTHEGASQWRTQYVSSLRATSSNFSLRITLKWRSNLLGLATHVNNFLRLFGLAMNIDESIHTLEGLLRHEKIKVIFIIYCMCLAMTDAGNYPSAPTIKPLASTVLGFPFATLCKNRIVTLSDSNENVSWSPWAVSV